MILNVAKSGNIRHCKNFLIDYFQSTCIVRVQPFRINYDNIVNRKVFKLISAFRDRGHYNASLDPLTSNRKSSEQSIRPSSWLPVNPLDHPDIVRLLRNYPEILHLEAFGLQDVPLDTKFDVEGELKGHNSLTLNELIEFLVNTYCGTVGIEFSHIENDNQRKWIEEKVEGEYGPNKWSLSNVDQIQALKRLLECDHTAIFLNRSFPNSKVFGIEGCESLIPGLWGVLEQAVTLGCEGLEMGMAHRGRMNVLHNFFKKPLKSICNQFNESDPSDLGDVKYHLGTRTQLEVKDLNNVTKVVHLSLAANPSHLEAVNPVVIGKCKAKQLFINDVHMKRVFPILLHGDASFSGQGIVPETLELSDLPV